MSTLAFAEYLRRRAIPSDISELMQPLYQLAKQCRRVTEFGVRSGWSTSALLAAGPEKLTGYDVLFNPEALELIPLAGNTDFKLIVGDTLAIEVEPTDMLHIDTRHTKAQLEMELARHANKVSTYIAFHDSITFGKVGEDGGPGLMAAIEDFLSVRQQWRIHQHHEFNNGLLVLRRA